MMEVLPMPDEGPQSFVTRWFDGEFQPTPGQVGLYEALIEDDRDEDELCPVCGAYWECDCPEES